MTRFVRGTVTSHKTAANASGYPAFALIEFQGQLLPKRLNAPPFSCFTTKNYVVIMPS